MARKRNCSKARKRAAVNNGPTNPLIVTRSEKFRIRQEKARLRIQIKELMRQAYGFWKNHVDIKPTKYTSAYAYHYFPETPDMISFIDTYIGSHRWNNLNDLSVEALRETHGWASQCRRQMLEGLNKRRFWRNTRRIVLAWVIISGLIIYFS